MKRVLLLESSYEWIFQLLRHRRDLQQISSILAVTSALDRVESQSSAVAATLELGTVPAGVTDIHSDRETSYLIVSAYNPSIVNHSLLQARSRRGNLGQLSSQTQFETILATSPANVIIFGQSGIVSQWTSPSR